MMEIYKMKLHDRIDENSMSVVRVAGGWLYSMYDFDKDVLMSPVFVPYCDEFQEKGQNEWLN